MRDRRHEDEPEIDAELQKDGANDVLGAEANAAREHRHWEREDGEQDDQVEVDESVLDIPFE